MLLDKVFNINKLLLNRLYKIKRHRCDKKYQQLLAARKDITK